jgi:plasmid replication initiation protein
MNKKQIERINSLYLYFMATHPQAEDGEYLSADTNCILAFAEYVENADYNELKKAIPELRHSQLASLKQHISAAVEDYLLRHAKVLAVS